MREKPQDRKSEDEPQREKARELTLADLEKAQEELRHWEDISGRDSSNNPNKCNPQIRDAAHKVRHI